MISDLIILILLPILHAIWFLLSLVNFVVPTQIAYWFSVFFSYVRIGDGIFPMSDMLEAILAVLTVWVLLYGVKIILFAFSAIPWIGRTLHLPSHSTKSMTTDEAGVVHMYGAGGEDRGVRVFKTHQTKRFER